MSKTPFKHGGARKGAGRPDAGTVPMTIRPRKETAERLGAIAREGGLTLGQVVDRLLTGQRSFAAPGR